MEESKKMDLESKNKYSKEFQVPPDFPNILRDLTREILRDQPTDINKYGKRSSIKPDSFINLLQLFNFVHFFFVHLNQRLKLTNILPTNWGNGKSPMILDQWRTWCWKISICI